MTYKTTTFSIILAGLLCCQTADAMPGFTSEAPQSSVASCIGKVNGEADFSQAGSVLHNVETEERRVSGHTMRIRTRVIGIDGDEVIREYATHCAINDNDEIKRFTMRRKGD